jgi:hypothetical protein
MVISRPASNTVRNVRRTLKCALNFVEYDAAKIQTILESGYPGQAPAEKMAYSTLTRVDSPTAGRRSGMIFPQTIAEPFQVFECTLDVARIAENPILRDSASAHLMRPTASTPMCGSRSKPAHRSPASRARSCAPGAKRPLLAPTPAGSFPQRTKTLRLVG